MRHNFSPYPFFSTSRVLQNVQHRNTFPTVLRILFTGRAFTQQTSYQNQINLNLSGSCKHCSFRCLGAFYSGECVRALALALQRFSINWLIPTSFIYSSNVWQRRQEIHYLTIHHSILLLFESIISHRQAYCQYAHTHIILINNNICSSVYNLLLCFYTL